MDDERNPGSGGRGGGGGAANGKSPAGVGSEGDPERSVDRFGLVNLGLEVAHAGESLARAGSLAGTLRGEQLSAELLVIDGHMKQIEKLFTRVRSYIREEARLALNLALDAEKSKGPTP